MTTGCFRQSLRTKSCDVTVGFPPILSKSSYLCPSRPVDQKNSRVNIDMQNKV